MIKLASLINIIIFFFLITFAIVNKSCKEDKNSIKSEEEAFLDDHYSPDKKWGYINSEGKLAIENKFDDCRDFLEGRAAVNFEGKWGFINTAGEFVIEPLYREAYGYQNNLALVRKFDNSWDLIDKTGEVKLTLQADRVFLPDGEIIRYSKQGFYSYLKLNGDTLTEKVFMQAADFQNSVAVVKQTKNYTLINTAGEAISKEYDRIYPRANNRYRVKQDGKYFFLSPNGKAINSIPYDLAFDYMDGEALVKSKGIYKVINEKARTLSTLNYSIVEPAGEGIYRVFNGNKWGLVNTRGNLIAEPVFDMFYNVSESHIAFSKNDLWGYMTIEGKIIRNPVHPLVWDFKDGYARVIEARRGIGYINVNGEMEIPPYFVDVRDFYENLARVQVY